MRKVNGLWARNCENKAEIVANYLIRIFQPNESQDYDLVSENAEQDTDIPMVIPKELCSDIEGNVNPEKLLAMT